jgi:hypothetical protein
MSAPTVRQVRSLQRNVSASRYFAAAVKLVNIHLGFCASFSEYLLGKLGVTLEFGVPWTLASSGIVPNHNGL